MNKEKNKSLVIGMINLCFILVLELIFMHVWELGLNVLQVNPFEHKGNWLIASVYLAEIFVFLRVYGGLKIGHLTKGEVILSQFLAFFIGNMVMLVLIILVVLGVMAILNRSGNESAAAQATVMYLERSRA